MTSFAILYLGETIGAAKVVTVPAESEPTRGFATRTLTKDRNEKLDITLCKW